MLKVYLAGEIHTNWREEIIENCKKENLDIQLILGIQNVMKVILG